MSLVAVSSVVTPAMSSSGTKNTGTALSLLFKFASSVLYYKDIEKLSDTEIQVNKSGRYLITAPMNAHYSYSGGWGGATKFEIGVNDTFTELGSASSSDYATALYYAKTVLTLVSGDKIKLRSTITGHGSIISHVNNLSAISAPLVGELAGAGAGMFSIRRVS